MKMKLSLALALLGLCSTSHAVVTVISESTPTVSNSFSDGEGDYFGIVEGGQIAGTGFSSTIDPPEGAVTGEDHDGEGLNRLQTATWTLGLPPNAVPGTGLTNIDFSGFFAANGGVFDSTDEFSFELSLNSSAVETILIAYDRANDDNFNENLAFDTTGDGIGDGATISETGTAINLSDAGGSAITSATVVLSADVANGDEEHWSNGVLMAEFDPIPEPSSALLGGLGLLALFRRRR
jgi:hypothetical protein